MLVVFSFLLFLSMILVIKSPSPAIPAAPTIPAEPTKRAKLARFANPAKIGNLRAPRLPEIIQPKEIRRTLEIDKKPEKAKNMRRRAIHDIDAAMGSGYTY